jgi:hypothetical protein
VAIFSDVSSFPYLQEDTQVVKELTAEVIASSSLLHHPSLQCFVKGGYKDMAMATHEFALNHYAYSHNFLKYLQNVKDKVTAAAPKDAHLLTENMNEEMGNYSEENL